MGFLTGKTVLITGGGRAVLSDGSAGSIGYGIATAYAKEGANIVITGRNQKKLLDAKEELERLYGVKVLPVQADISAGADNGATAASVVEQAVAEKQDWLAAFAAVDYLFIQQLFAIPDPSSLIYSNRCMFILRYDAI